MAVIAGCGGSGGNISASVELDCQQDCIEGQVYQAHVEASNSKGTIGLALDISNADEGDGHILLESFVEGESEYAASFSEMYTLGPTTIDLDINYKCLAPERPRSRSRP